MNSLKLKLFFIAIVKVIGNDRWEKVMEQVTFLDLHPVAPDGETKKKIAMDKLKWLIADLRDGKGSAVFASIAHILISIAIDAAVAKLKMLNRGKI